MSSPAPITANVPPPKTAGRRGVMLRILLVVVVVGLIGWGAWYWLEGRWYESTDDAFVDGRPVLVSPQVTGSIVNVNVTDNQIVKTGDLLIEARHRVQEAGEDWLPWVEENCEFSKSRPSGSPRSTP